jgi:hypothetical protein
MALSSYPLVDHKSGVRKSDGSLDVHVAVAVAVAVKDHVNVNG